MMGDGYNRCDFAASFGLLSSVVNEQNDGFFLLHSVAKMEWRRRRGQRQKGEGGTDRNNNVLTGNMWNMRQ